MKIDRSRIEKFRASNWISIGMYAGVVMIFVFSFLFPAYQRMKNLDERIHLLEDQIQQQKLLNPIYDQIKEKLDELKIMTEPIKTTICEKLGETECLQINALGFDFSRMPERCGNGDFNIKIRDVCQKNNYKSMRIKADMIPNSNEALTRLSMRGEMVPFYEILIRLSTTPCVRKIDEIHVTFSDRVDGVDEQTDKDIYLVYRAVQ